MAADGGDDAAASRGAEGATEAVAERQNLGQALMDLINSGAAAPDSSKTAIAALRDSRKALSAQKRGLTQQLRNETKKRARMMSKSAKLSSLDLVEVLHIRQSRVLAAKAKAQPAG